MRSSSHIYSKMRVISLVQIENQNALLEISFFFSISHFMISWKELVCLVIIWKRDIKRVSTVTFPCLSVLTPLSHQPFLPDTGMSHLHTPWKTLFSTNMSSLFQPCLSCPLAPFKSHLTTNNNGCEKYCDHMLFSERQQYPKGFSCFFLSFSCFSFFFFAVDCLRHRLKNSRESPDVCVMMKTHNEAKKSSDLNTLLIM